MIDVDENRLSVKWSRTELFLRTLWGLSFPLFRFSPRPLWGWRRGLLKLFGAHIGRDVHIYPSVRVSIPWNLQIGDQSAIGDRAILYALGRIVIGERTTISQGAHLCAGTHDITKASRPLLKLPIVVGSDVWIAADAFVGPGVTIGKGAIVGARAVAMKDIRESARVVGNPARELPYRKAD